MLDFWLDFICNSSMKVPKEIFNLFWVDLEEITQRA